MTAIRVFSLLLAFALLSPAAFAQEVRKDLVVRNSLDYTMDDGVMSKEEMEMEAQDVYRLCTANVYQKKYFDCACLAGAFLQQREKLGPLVMQYEIHKIITNSPETNASCANTADIAGDAYESCVSYIRGYSETELEDPKDYCTCVANKMARDYSKAPRLSTGYVETLRSNAMNECTDPQRRAVMKTQADRNRAAAQAAAANKVPAATPPAPSNTLN